MYKNKDNRVIYGELSDGFIAVNFDVSSDNTTIPSSSVARVKHTLKVEPTKATIIQGDNVVKLDKEALKALSIALGELKDKTIDVSYNID